MKMMFDPVKFSERIRLAIARANIDQKTMAKQAKVEPASISRICRHHKSPTVESYLRITAWLEKVEKCS